MSEEPEGNKAGASGGEGEKTSSTEPQVESVKAEAKVEVKEGKVLVDGKPFVAEHHLLAAKKSLEGKLETQQTAHDKAIDEAKLEASNAQQQIATLNAKIKETEEARSAGAVSDEDAARIKTELETAKSSIETLTADAAKALEYRRANLVLQYGVVPDTIKDKDMTALDSFEEALKAVSTAKGGVGAYAVGGGTGEAAPQTNEERARKILDSTPVRGVRTAEAEK